MDRTVLKYYLFEVTRNAHLSGPIWVLFLLSRGVSYSGIGLLDAVFSVTVLLAETPTGYLGDRIGRRWSLAVGILGTSLGSLWFAFATSLPEFLAAYVLLAVARTFTSGSDSAWLYDTLEARTDEDRYARLRGRGKAIGLTTAAVGAVVGGVIAQFGLALPWIASGLLTALGLPVVVSFPTPDRRSLDDSAADESTPFAALVAARASLTRPPLRWFVLYTGVFAGVMGVINFFVQPVTLAAVPTPPAVAGVRPDGVVVVGLVFAAFQLTAAVLTARAGWISDRVGIDRWFRLAPLGVGGAFALVTLLPTAAVPLFFLLRAVRSVSQPLQSTYVNERTPSVGRATTLSAVSMAHAVIVAPLELGGGALADRLGATDAMAALGAGLVAVALLLQGGRRLRRSTAD